MLNHEAIPLLDPTSRHLFEVAALEGNTILQTSVLIDKQIEKAQYDAYYARLPYVPEFTDEIVDMTQQAYDAIEEADHTGQGTWTDYYRLVGQTAFLEQRLKAPFAFTQRCYWRERGDLVNGIYGVSAQIISEALLEYDSGNITPSEKDNLRGVIHEQTFLALFNKEEQKKHIAMPSATCADFYQKVDAEVWILPDRQSEPFYLPVQIKSSIQTAEENVAPHGGIALAAHEFDNLHNFRISRLIARDYHYMMGTAEPLTRIQRGQLTSTHTKLFATMRRKAGHDI